MAATKPRTIINRVGEIQINFGNGIGWQYKVNRIKKNSINKETERETENEEKSCVRK